MQDTNYLPPVRWDLKRGKSILKTVRFESRYMSVAGKRYTVAGTDGDNDDFSYCLTSVETGECRFVKGSVIRKWLDNFT